MKKFLRFKAASSPMELNRADFLVLVGTHLDQVKRSQIRVRELQGSAY